MTRDDTKGDRQDKTLSADTVVTTRALSRRSKPAMPPELYQRVLKRCASLTTRLNADADLAKFAADNRRSYRADLQRAIRAQLPLRRGRPTDPKLDAAYVLVRQGKTVPEILRSQIPDWDRRDPYDKLLMQKGLHQAMMRRRKRLP